MTKIFCSGIFTAYTFILSLTGLAIFQQASAQSEGRIVMDIQGYPLVFELDEGETQVVKRSYRGQQAERSIKVLSIKHFMEPNFWFSGEQEPRNYSKAEVVVEVSGERATLVHRPYESPAVVNGLRIYVETTQEWARNAEYADLKDIQKHVRLSVCLEDEPWGPGNFIFPISDYRWRSAVYNNTWSSLVPYNLLYYHRGEDYGAIPDILDVVSPADGIITGTPLPAGDGKSNAIYIENAAGVIFRISHMNTESIRTENPVGTKVSAGTVLAKTGMTWDGRKSQVNDPHCHIDITWNETKLASFPYLIEAYLRTYDDPVLAVAGGYAFTTVGAELILDGRRSIARPEDPVQSYTWKLHNGQTIASAKTTLKYNQPGLYTEELIVVSESGAEDRDYLQVQVYDQQRGRSGIAYGWAYYSPLRDISPGTPVLFWNRLVRTNGPVTIDFGDGSAPKTIDKLATHSYLKKGNYTVTLSSVDAHNHPVTAKLEVKVE